MGKKITAIILATAFAATLTACSPTQKEERTKYDIDASLSKENVLDATVTCDYLNANDVPLGELCFHMYPNAYREGADKSPISDSKKTEAFPNGMSYSELTVKKVAVNGVESKFELGGEDATILSVALPEKLEPDSRIGITVEYSVKLPNVRHRFGYTDNSVNLANFYPIACVYRDGAFVTDPYYANGDPFMSEVADYTVTMTAPSDYVGTFTGSVQSETKSGENTVYEVAAENVRDFAAVLGKFEKVSGVAGSTIVNYYYYADEQPEKALNTAIDAIKTFGEMFGEYAYPEYSVVQTSFVHGGMEYPMLSMISDAYTGDVYNDVIVHETAHQWWYAAVGNDEVRNAWMDEGLAEYSTMMFYEQNTEGYNYTFSGKRADALSAYTLYCETYKNNGLGDTSMTRAVNEYGNEIEYTYMTYVKGAIMFDDIRNTIGDAAFKAGLKEYYNTCKNKIAKPEDLVGAMEKASNRKISALFDSWLSGKVKLYSNN